MGYYPEIKQKEILSLSSKLLELEGIMLNKLYHAQ